MKRIFGTIALCAFLLSFTADTASAAKNAKPQHQAARRQAKRRAQKKNAKPARKAAARKANKRRAA